MDGNSSPCEREIKRSFLVDRHSALLLAKDFELLLASSSSVDVQSTEQCALEGGRIQPLQEVNQ